MVVSLKNPKMDNMFSNKSIESMWEDASKICEGEEGDKLGWINEAPKIFKKGIFQGVNRTFANISGDSANCENSSKLAILWAQEFEKKVIVEISKKHFSKDKLGNKIKTIYAIEKAFANFAKTYRNSNEMMEQEKYSNAINNFNCSKNIMQSLRKNENFEYKKIEPAYKEIKYLGRENAGGNSSTLLPEDRLMFDFAWSLDNSV